MLAGFHRGLEVVDADIVKEVAEKLNLDSLVRRPQLDAASHQPAAAPEAIGATQLARALAAALNAEARPDANSETQLGQSRNPKSS